MDWQFAGLVITREAHSKVVGLVQHEKCKPLVWIYMCCPTDEQNSLFNSQCMFNASREWPKSHGVAQLFLSRAHISCYYTSRILSKTHAYSATLFSHSYYNSRILRKTHAYSGTLFLQNPICVYIIIITPYLILQNFSKMVLWYTNRLYTSAIDNNYVRKPIRHCAIVPKK